MSLQCWPEGQDLAINMGNIMGSKLQSRMRGWAVEITLVSELCATRVEKEGSREGRAEV